MSQRHFGIDLLKVLCAQLIVLHHAVLYAPAGLHFDLHWPHLAEFLLEPGRWVVHVFLVLGGYLSAISLARTHHHGWLTLAWRRYARLMPMFLWATVVTVLMGAMVRFRYAPDFVTPAPGLWSWIAHVTLSFDWWGISAVSAGAWYVAMDFQLYVLLTLWVLLARRRNGAPWMGWRASLMGLAVVWSAIWLSRMPELDVVAPYFWSSYGLGVLVAWSQQGGASRRWLWCVLIVLAFDLLFDFRGRQALAWVTAVLLYVWPMLKVTRHTPRWMANACDLSYAVFVGHFSMLIALGSWWAMHGANHPLSALAYAVMCAAMAWFWGFSLQAMLERSRAWLARYFGTWARWA